MKIIQYVEFTTPTEKQELEKLMITCNSEFELRSKIAKTFGISSIEAGIVVSRFRNKFNQLKQK